MLQIEHLTKIYKDEKVAVDNLTLSIEKGDIYGFIGHNGAGKTTTIKCVVGIQDFNKGEILIDGHSIKTDAMACKKIIAYIPDNPELYEHMTGVQYLNFIADIYEVSQEKRNKLINEYSERFEILQDLGSAISSYSRGMHQKLAIISALIHEPKLLILDEPFVGLDPKASRTLKEIMQELCDQGGSIFFSTHVLEVAEKLCNKVAIINKGKLVAAGNMEEIIQDKTLEDIFMEALD